MDNVRLLNILIDLYSAIQSCVKSSDKPSDYFNCNIGERQIENLAPLLFAIS